MSPQKNDARSCCFLTGFLSSVREVATTHDGSSKTDCGLLVQVSHINTAAKSHLSQGTGTAATI